MSRPKMPGMIVGTLIVAGCSAGPSSRHPQADWMRMYGGPASETAAGIVPAGADGYYIVGTEDLRFSGVSKASVSLTRTDLAGEVLWTKSYGGEGVEQGRSIVRSSDGGLVIGAQTTSSGAGGTDARLMKVDENGEEVWARTYGTALDELVTVVLEMPGGGYVVAGSVLDPDDAISDAGVAGYFGADHRSSPWLVRTDAEGNEIWSRTFDAGTNALLSDALPTRDGGILVLVSITYFPDSDDDLVLLKLDEQGHEIWSRTWDEGRRYGHDLIETADGNYMITGSYARAGDTDFSEADFLFITVDPEGTEIWSRTFGDPVLMDWGRATVEDAGSGFVVVGTRTEDLHGTPESIVLLRMGESGGLLWERVFETDTHNMLGSLLQTADGGFVVSGSTRVDIGNFDIFLIVTDPEGNAVRLARAPDSE